AVGAHEAHDAALLDVEGDVGERRETAEALAEPADRQEGVHRGSGVPAAACTGRGSRAFPPLRASGPRSGTSPSCGGGARRLRSPASRCGRTRTKVMRMAPRTSMYTSGAWAHRSSDSRVRNATPSSGPFASSPPPISAIAMTVTEIIGSNTWPTTKYV